jgi:ABC-2 type transport system permease protein
MKNIGTIIGFEYVGYLKNKAFRVTTIILIAIILIISAFPQLRSAMQGLTVGGEKSSALLIMEKGTLGNIADTLVNDDVLNQIAGDYAWETGGGSEDPKKIIEDKKYDVVLTYDGGASYKLYGSGHDFDLYGLIEILNEYFTGVSREAALQSLPPEARAGAEQVLGTAVVGEIEAVGGDAGSNYWVSYIMLYLLFMVTMMYGQFVISSVVNEKTTKAMELLITSARPMQLMFGKVLGVGCAALTQLLLIVAATVVGFLINFDSWKEGLPDVADSIMSTNLSPALVVFFLLFFVAGYFLYAFIYAALGSTVSKIEDAGTVTTLPTLLVVAAFMVSIIGMTNIEAGYVKILSYIPFFSPFIMFARVSMGEAGYLQGVIALLILVPTVVLFSWVAAKIYRIGVMMYGKPMKLKEILKVAVQR